MYFCQFLRIVHTPAMGIALPVITHKDRSLQRFERPDTGGEEFPVRLVRRFKRRFENFTLVISIQSKINLVFHKNSLFSENPIALA